MSPKARINKKPIPPPPGTVYEIKDPQGGRNFIRAKDPVHVGPSRPGKRDGFDARFVSAKEKDGVVVEVTVFGGPTTSKGQYSSLRTFRPERIFRKAVTKAGVKKAAAR